MPSTRSASGRAAPALWALLIANGFLWPHLAYLRVKLHRGDPLSAEFQNLTFDAAMGGFWIAAMQFDADSRPDFAVGVYPAWPAQLDVPPQAPPLFLVMSDDDPQVAPLSASRLYEAWHKAGSPAELHVFGNGGHGYGMSPDGWLSDIWPELLRRWMAERGLLPKTR